MVRREILEAAAPPELRDREMRRRIAETESQEALVLELLAGLGVHPEHGTSMPGPDERPTG